MLKKIIQLLNKISRLYYSFKVKRQCSKFGVGLKVNGKSAASKNTQLGENVNFNGMRIQGRGSVYIGNNFHSGSECMIIAEIHNYEGECIPYDNTYKYRGVKIEDNVWLGNRVIILDGVHIGEGAIIQAGSCVVSDIPSCAIAGGHPAKVFSYRNIEHYQYCKESAKFH